MIMITEDYVSFETAKLLKEKGFDETCYMAYIETNREYQLAPSAGYSNTDWDKLFKDSGVKNYACPTLQMAMKWLRETHKIHIQIWILEDNGYWFDIEKILNTQYKHKSLYSTGLEDIYFNSYEEACEVAIKYCLENLI